MEPISRLEILTAEDREISDLDPKIRFHLEAPIQGCEQRGNAIALGYRIAHARNLKALEQIEELKRLCENIIEKYRKARPFDWSNDQWVTTTGAFCVVLNALNGDPTELKKLAGEE